MSHDLLRNLLQAGIDARLSKNEWAVYATLLTQTLGYGKQSDALTTKRIAYQSGIRRDRTEIALASVLQHGLFEAAEHAQWGWEYRIPEKYFSSPHGKRFFAPDLPQNRKTSRNSEAISEIRGHTEINPYRVKPTQTTTAHDSPSEQTPPTSPPIADHHRCRHDLNIPPEISAQLLQSLAAALQSLQQDDAQCIVDLLAVSLRQGGVRNPLRYAYGLINRLHAGTLNRTVIPPDYAPPSPERKTIARNASHRLQQAEQAMLERLSALSGVPLEQLGGLNT